VKSGDASTTSQKRISAELDAMIRLHKLSALSVTEHDLGKILCEIVDVAIDLTGADFGNIQLIDPVSSELTMVVQRGFPQWWLAFWNSVPSGTGTCGVSVERRERVIVEDVDQSPIFSGPTLEVQRKVGVRAVQSTPLVSRSGKPIGMFSTHYKKPHRPNESTLRLLDLLARQAADIIEHVQYLAALNESEKRLRLVLDASRAGSWTRDVRTGRVDWDDRFREIYGFSAKEPASFETWLGRLHEEDRPQELDLWDQILHATTHDNFDTTFRIVRPEGTVSWIQSLGQVHRDADGQVVRLTGLELDVTARRRDEEALRCVSAELRQTLHVAATGLTHCSRDLRYLSANPAYARWVGRPLEEIIGRPIVEVMGEPAFEIVRPRIERVLRGETVEYEDEVPIGGLRKCIRVAYTPDQDASGNVIGWVASIMDITERKRAEEAVRQQASMLRLSFDAVMVWRFDGVIESWNLGAETLYGFAEREAIGHDPHDLLHTVFPVSCSDTETILKDEGKWEGELRHRTKDGREVIVSALLQCIRDDGGTVRVLEINRDITERKRMEEQRAEEERRKDEFLSLLGHELRNPLAAISAAVQLLSENVSGEKRTSLNGMMDRQVKLMRRLLDDLLDLGRITHGYIQLKKERIDLAEFLQHITEVTQPTAAEREQELILRLPSEVVTFKADEARLEQIAINLLNNASKYTAQGGRIEFSGTREGSEVVLRCKDNGRGIPVEMQQKIFEPFTRVGPLSDSRGEASLGIGLTLVKRLVELHGGSISVESRGPGTGSEFLVRLPLEPILPDQAVAPETEPSSTLGRGRSIVLVEDNSDVAGTMVVAFERAGYRVTRFIDGPSALAGLSSLKPHAILLDIGLPGMDGYELAAELRKRRNLQHALFIAISGFKRRQGDEAANDFDHYFNKPVDLSSLLKLLGSTPAQTGQAMDATAGPSPEKTALRVLLIDDHAAFAAAMAELLSREGLVVQTALSGEEGLKFALDFRPQLILCDLNLPDMTGQEVIRQLRLNPFGRHAYSVILTALSDAEIRTFNEEAKKIGVDEFISKPLTVQDIHFIVAKLKR